MAGGGDAFKGCVVSRDGRGTVRWNTKSRRFLGRGLSEGTDEAEQSQTAGPGTGRTETRDGDLLRGGRAEEAGEARGNRYDRIEKLRNQYIVGRRGAEAENRFSTCPVYGTTIAVNNQCRLLLLLLSACGAGGWK